MNGREISRKMSTKKTNAQTQAMQRNKEMAKSGGRRSVPKQQRQESQRQRRLKTTLYSTDESRENLDSLGFSISARNIPNIICKTALKFEKETLKLIVVVHVLSNMQNAAISRCCFMKNMSKEMITPAYTNIVLVAVAVEVCFFNSQH